MFFLLNLVDKKSEFFLKIVKGENFVENEL